VNLAFPAEYDQLRSVVRRSLVDARGDARGAPDRGDASRQDELWRQAVSAGWTRVGIPESYGGEGGGYTALAVVAEELGRELVGGPFLPTMFLAGPLVLSAGDDAARREILPRICAGDVVSFTVCGSASLLGSQLSATATGLTGTMVGPALRTARDVLVLDFPALDRRHRPWPMMSLRGLARTEARPAKFVGTVEQPDLTQDIGCVEIGAAPMADIGCSPEFAQRSALALCGLVVLVAFEQVGGAAQVVDLAVRYAAVRQQFGRPIGTFQAIAHDLANIHVAVELARSNALLALWRLEQAVALSRLRALSAGELAILRSDAARAFASATDAYRYAAQESIHVHGGFGCTWTAGLHHFLRRCIGRELILGSSRSYHHMVGAQICRTATRRDRRPAGSGPLLEDPLVEAADLDAGVDDDGSAISLADSPAERAFREEARTWLQGQRPPRGRGEDEPGRFSRSARYTSETVAEARAWQAAKAAAGWAGLSWPPEHGGRGLGAGHQLIWDQEEARFDVPPTLFAIAIRIVGPTLIANGSVAQQSWLEPILRGEHIWALLLSEPDAGSDLLSLTTRASRDGSGWEISGQKTWSSGAHVADFGLLLARTSPRASGRPGVTLFRVDMHAPGVRIRPIRQLDGSEAFCDVHLDQVRVSDDDRVGEVDGGWTVMATAFANERMFIGTRGELGPGTVLGELVSLFRTSLLGRATAREPGVLQRLGELATKAAAIRGLEYRAVTEMSRGRDPATLGNMAKLANGQLVESAGAFAMELLCSDDAFRGCASRAALAVWSTVVLRAPGGRVGGGTDEIQRSTIARRLLHQAASP